MIASGTRKCRVQPRARTRDHSDPAHRRQGGAVVVWLVVGFVLTLTVGYALISTRPTDSDTTRPAPPFTLTDTRGERVSLADYRGQNVLLYFNEGAGCQSCLTQMAAIERDRAAFAAADVTVLPIVMNSGQDILADMTANGVTTPFLLDNGTVSAAYGTLGKGMHGDLPGHSFVLIDGAGVQRWYGEYPAMWLAPGELLAKVKTYLSAG